jgi:type I restriction enzyme S subunit
MNAERLLAHFERISEAPDALARLRRFILDLAVRGKLVEQDAEDEPAGELLLQFQQSRRKSHAKGTRENRGSQLSSMAEPRHSIPDNWMWAPIGMIFYYDAGTKTEPKILEQNSWLLELEDLEKDTGRLLTRSTVSDRKPQSTKSKFQANDILYGKLRPYLNKVFVADRAGYSSTEIVALRPIFPLSSEYCKLALRRPDFVEYVTRLGQGTKMPRLRTEDAVIAPFPLPPLAEQHRIVAKVDELMALCDQLEAARQQREQGRERLVAATLQRLNQPAEDPASFHKDASFALQVLPSLTTTPAQIKQLRQTILNLAVRGKLVEQDPEDEPADVRLVQIQRALSSTIASMGLRLKRSSSLSPAASPEGDFAGVPSSWALSTLGSLAIVLDPNPSHRYPSYDGGTVPILSTQEFSGLDGWDPSTAKLVPHSFFEYQLANCRFERGDIVFARKGRLGLPRLLPNFEQFTFSHTVFLVKPMPGVFPEYLLWLLRRDQVIAWLTNEMNANTGVPTLGKEKMELLPIPLPPLAEQHRIVAKVGELMALCDQLEQQLSQADQQRRRLLEAVLAEALVEPEQALAAMT